MKKHIKKLYLMVDWFEFQKSIMMGAVLTVIISLVLSIMIFHTGMHNLDTGWNMRVTELSLNVSFQDFMSDYQLHNAKYIITLGYEQIRTGLIATFIFSLILGYFLTSLRFMVRKG